MTENMIKKNTQIICTLLSYIPKFGTFSFILGSRMATFSVSQCFGPLSGFFGCPLSTSILFAIRILITGLLSSAYHIPGFCGALYLSSRSYIIRMGLPLLCILLFILHPVGSQAYIYSFYWIIPLLCAFQTRSIFLQALGSTFTTHAVGSVIWLYTHALTATDWQLLIGVVWAERLLTATALTAGYYVICYIYNKLSNKFLLSARYKNSAL